MPLSYDPQVIQILANAAQAYGRGVRERQRMKIQQAQFEDSKKQAEKNFKLREDNLALEQKKFDLAKKKEASLQKSRQERTDVRREELELKRYRAGLETYKTLTPKVRGKIENVNKQIMGEVLNQPLVSEEGYDLRAYQDYSINQIARHINGLKKSLARVDSIDRRLHDDDIAAGGTGLPAINELERQIRASQEALNLRQRQYDEVRLSSISKFTQDPEVAAGVESAFLTNLGKSLGAIQVPDGEPSAAAPQVKQPGQATAAPPTTEGLEAAGKKPEAATAAGGVPLTPLAQVITKLDFNDRNSVEQVAVEAARLSPQDAQNLLLTLQDQLSQDELLTFMKKVRTILRGK